MQGSNHSNHHLENVVHSAILPSWISTTRNCQCWPNALAPQSKDALVGLHYTSWVRREHQVLGVCWCGGGGGGGGGVDTLQSQLIPRDHRWSGIIQVLGSYEYHVILGKFMIQQLPLIRWISSFRAAASNYISGNFMRNKHFAGNLFKRHLSKWVRPWTRGPHLYSLY